MSTSVAAVGVMHVAAAGTAAGAATAAVLLAHDDERADHVQPLCLRALPGVEDALHGLQNEPGSALGPRVRVAAMASAASASALAALAFLAFFPLPPSPAPVLALAAAGLKAKRHDTLNPANRGAGAEGARRGAGGQLTAADTATLQTAGGRAGRQWLRTW